VTVIVVLALTAYISLVEVRVSILPLKRMPVVVAELYEYRLKTR
jgi:hypothetical protein